MGAAIHTEECFEDEVCETLKAKGWLFDGPLPHHGGHAYDAGYDKRVALYTEDAIAWVKETQQHRLKLASHLGCVVRPGLAHRC